MSKIGCCDLFSRMPTGAECAGAVPPTNGGTTYFGTIFANGGGAGAAELSACNGGVTKYSAAGNGGSGGGTFPFLSFFCLFCLFKNIFQFLFCLFIFPFKWVYGLRLFKSISFLHYNRWITPFQLPQWSQWRLRSGSRFCWPRK